MALLVKPLPTSRYCFALRFMASRLSLYSSPLHSHTAFLRHFTGLSRASPPFLKPTRMVFLLGHLCHLPLPLKHSKKVQLPRIMVLNRSRCLKVWTLLGKSLGCILGAQDLVDCIIWFMKYWTMLLMRTKPDILQK